MTEYLTNDTDLKKVADAIREKGGTTEKLTYPDGFAAAIAAISSGSGIPGFSVLTEVEVPHDYAGQATFSVDNRTRENTMLLFYPDKALPSIAQADACLLKDAIPAYSCNGGGGINVESNGMAESFGNLEVTITFNEGSAETWHTLFSKIYVIGIG
nr:MAG TPA: hypothetical protein [Caudoviricetes sp.]